jgi:hypothetical protein
MPLQTRASVEHKGGKRKRETVLLPVHRVFAVFPFQVVSFAHLSFSLVDERLYLDRTSVKHGRS